ncbi:MAG: serpin family protein [Thermomicrobiales bacterium]
MRAAADEPGFYNRARLRIRTARFRNTTAPERAMPTTDVAVDRPFIFAIVDRETSEILFPGRVADPTS